MEEKGRRRRRVRVVLVPFPFQGHINPMLQLGSILHSNGFSITVVHAQYNSPDPSTHPDFSFVPLPDTSSSPDFTAEVVASIVQLNTNYNAKSYCEREPLRTGSSAKWLFYSLQSPFDTSSSKKNCKKLKCAKKKKKKSKSK
jgi:hypothetical protein